MGEVFQNAILSKSMKILLVVTGITPHLLGIDFRLKDNSQVKKESLSFAMSKT